MMGAVWREGLSLVRQPSVRSDSGYYIGVVTNAVVGGWYSARLNEEIRIKRGLSYCASSRLAPLSNAGLWLAAAQTRKPSAAAYSTPIVAATAAGAGCPTYRLAG